MGAEQQSGRAGTSGATSDSARIHQTFSRVMQKVKQAYHKELQRKKQVDLTASVDIMRTRTNEETNDSESNEDDEAMQAMAKVSSLSNLSLDHFISQNKLLFVCRKSK